MTIPQGVFSNERVNGKVLQLLQSIYGLQHASGQWFSKFIETFISFGFKESVNDYSLFTYSDSKNLASLLVYVDDSPYRNISEIHFSHYGICTLSF